MSPRAPRGGKEGVVAAAGLVVFAVACALILWRWSPWSAAAAMVEYPMLKRTDIPAAVAIGSDGAVWFTMDLAAAVGVLRDGKIERIALEKENVEPIGLAVDPAGNAWFTDVPGRAIRRMSPQGKLETFALGTPIARLGRLAIAPDGAVWFAEKTAYSITRLNDGVFERHIIQSARGGPYGIAIDAQGNCWATLQQANQILKIAPGGAMEWFWVPTPASAPSDIAIDREGAVWFLQYRTNKVGRLKDSQFAEYSIPGALSGLAGLAVAPDGAVWFGMLREGSLGRLHRGQLQKFALPRANARPAGVAVSAAGDVWYVDITGYLGKLPAEQARVQQ